MWFVCQCKCLSQNSFGPSMTTGHSPWQFLALCDMWHRCLDLRGFECCSPLSSPIPWWWWIAQNPSADDSTHFFSDDRLPCDRTWLSRGFTSISQYECQNWTTLPVLNVLVDAVFCTLHYNVPCLYDVFAGHPPGHKLQYGHKDQIHL